MEIQYYMIIDGRQAGPFVAGELRYHGIRPDSMVWRQGLSDWVAASTLVELAGLFAVPPVPGSEEVPPVYPDMNSGMTSGMNAGAAPADRQSGYSGSNPFQGQYDQAPIEHTNWLPWAIVCTVLGTMTSCLTLILGIIAIVQANKANDFYRRGNRMMGDSANSTAKTLAVIGLVLAVLAIIGLIAFFTTGLLQNYLDLLEQLD